MKGRIVLSLVGLLFAAGVIAAGASVGLPVLFALSWLLLAVAIGVITRQAVFDDATAWPPPAPDPAPRGSEVSRLAWAINTRSGVVGQGMVRRLDAALRQRARGHGLDVDDPGHAAALEALFGPGIRTVLHGRAVHRRDVERVLVALESLPPTQERR